MTRVLAIDTAGPVIGVALCVADTVLERTVRVERGAEAQLVPWVLELCAEGGVSVAMLDGFAVSVGPGAFTGLRVGLATAIGLAMSGDRPLWPCDSLTPRAQRVARSGRVLSMLDARKSRVYGAWFESGAMLRPAADIDPGTLLAAADGAFVATGEGALAYRNDVEAAGGIVDSAADHPATDVLARLGAAALARGEGRDPVLVQPFYLRDADATPPKR